MSNEIYLQYPSRKTILCSNYYCTKLLEDYIYKESMIKILESAKNKLSDDIENINDIDKIRCRFKLESDDQNTQMHEHMISAMVTRIELKTYLEAINDLLLDFDNKKKCITRIDKDLVKDSPYYFMIISANDDTNLYSVHICFTYTHNCDNNDTQLKYQDVKCIKGDVSKFIDNNNEAKVAYKDIKNGNDEKLISILDNVVPSCLANYIFIDNEYLKQLINNNYVIEDITFDSYCKFIIKLFKMSDIISKKIVKIIRTEVNLDECDILKGDLMYILLKDSEINKTHESEFCIKHCEDLDILVIISGRHIVHEKERS